MIPTLRSRAAKPGTRCRKLTKLILKLISVLSRRALMQLANPSRDHTALLLATGCPSQYPEAGGAGMKTADSKTEASLQPGFRNRRLTPRSSSGVRNPSQGDERYWASLKSRRDKEPSANWGPWTPESPRPSPRKAPPEVLRLFARWILVCCTSASDTGRRSVTEKSRSSQGPQGNRPHLAWQRWHPETKMISAQTAELRLPSLLKLQSFAM